VACILVIEDTPSIAEVARRILSEAGYEVRAGNTGVEALRLWQEGGVDLVLTDLHLPDTNGVAIAKELRSIDPAVKIIMMSGSTGDADLKDLQAVAGPVPIGVLQKPFARRQLLAAVEEQLGPAPGG
jgi:CheY-like chemotaxis protein